MLRFVGTVIVILTILGFLNIIDFKICVGPAGEGACWDARHAKENHAYEN